MRTVLHVYSKLAQRALLLVLSERGHEVQVEEAEEAPVWGPATMPELLIVEVPAGHEGAERCRRLRDRARVSDTGREAPYVLAVVAPGGGEDAIEAGADNFVTGVDGELHAHVALVEQAIARRQARTAAEDALAERVWELRTVADHDRDLIAVIALHNGPRYAFVNRAFASTVGIPAEAFVGRAIEELRLPFAGVVAWPAHLAETAASRTRTTIEFDAPDGPVARRYSAVIVPEVRESAHVAELLVIVSELSDRPPGDAGRREQRARQNRGRPLAGAHESGAARRPSRPRR